LISFSLKVLPIIVGLVFAWIASKKPSTKKAFAEIQGIIKEAADIVTQAFVEPRKAGGTWDEEAKKQARELFWKKFMELAMAKAEYWLNYLIGIFGEEQLKQLVVESETGGMVEAVIKK
jgi:hypothetical protein